MIQRDHPLFFFLKSGIVSGNRLMTVGRVSKRVHSKVSFETPAEVPSHFDRGSKPQVCGLFYIQ